LKRVTVSLDALDDAVFQRMNDVGFPVADVLAGIDAALAAGLAPVKVNMVVKRGTNEQEIIPMARWFRDRYGGAAVLRFIEFMDVGQTNGWRMDHVLPSAEVIERIASVFPLEPLDAAVPGETAERWRYLDGGGEIGVISSVTQAFCRECNRARLSTEGQLYLCLFATEGHDLRHLLRATEASDAQIGAAIEAIWTGRDDRYSELRSSGQLSALGARKVEMHYIGG
jgi:cyclic pyranopterin phosphate synthase